MRLLARLLKCLHVLMGKYLSCFYFFPLHYPWKHLANHSQQPCPSIAIWFACLDCYTKWRLTTSVNQFRCCPEGNYWKWLMFRLVDWGNSRQFSECGGLSVLVRLLPLCDLNWGGIVLAHCFQEISLWSLRGNHLGGGSVWWSLLVPFLTFIFSAQARTQDAEHVG